MGTVINVILDILAILAIIVFGSFIVVVIADLILCCFDDHEGIIFRRKKKSESKTETVEEETVKKDDIVVYSNQTNPNGTISKEQKVDTVDGEVVTDIDFDKAVEEQQALSRKKGIEAPKPMPAPAPKPKKVEKDEDLFWNVEDDEEFTTLLDDVIKEAKGEDKKQKEEVKVENKVDDATQKELEELRTLKEQQQKEIEEFKKMKEDFAREKEEQLAIFKDNLDKAKEEELEKLKQEAIKEQEKLEAERQQLEAERQKLESEQVKEVVVEDGKEEIVKETIIKDEEELNKLKYKNLMRMNSRLGRIIRDAERLQTQKQKEIERQEVERQRLIALEQEEKIKEQERRLEIQKKNQEMLLKQAEALRKKNEINRKLNEVSKKAGKYKLDNTRVRISTEPTTTHHEVVEEVVTTVEQTIPGTDTVVKTVEKEPMKVTPKPIFEKGYYEQKLNELDEELREAEKELRINKSEYIPLTRIHKAYARDSEKLRKKEIQVAKQKVALYGVNSTKVDPVKKAKLDENLSSLAELKDSVEHCEEVIKKNKDRYPVLEKNNKLILKQIDRINEDMKVCEKAISYYNKKEK